MIEKYISNQKLKDTLAYFVKYVGSSPYDAPAILNMMIYMQYDQGAWYVPGGMNKIAEGLVRLGKEAGVAFYTDMEVTRLIEKEMKIIQAKLADGSLIDADYFISNMEVIPAYDRLLNEKKLLSKSLKINSNPPVLVMLCI